MRDGSDVLISLHSQFVRGIVAGTKRIELRRRVPKIASGSRVWLYNKSPIACINAMVELISVQAITPDALWDEHHALLGLSEDVYRTYVQGREIVGALHLGKSIEISPITLEEIRKVRQKFQPPQYYINIREDDPIRNLLHRHIHDAA